MILFTMCVPLTSLFSGVQAMCCDKAQLAKWVIMPLIFAIIAVMPATVSAFECSPKLKSCENKDQICNKFNRASKLNKQQCRQVWNKYKDSGNATCKSGVQDTYYNCLTSDLFSAILSGAILADANQSGVVWTDGCKCTKKQLF